MINIQNLKEFLVKAKKSTYASGDELKKIKEGDKSTTLVFEEGDYTYLNNYSGEVNNFSGEEIIKLKGEEIYKANYMGGLVNQG